MPLYNVHFHAVVLQSQECAADSPEDAVEWAQVNLRARLDRDPKYTGELQPNAVVDLVDGEDDACEPA